MGVNHFAAALERALIPDNLQLNVPSGNGVNAST
jgi:hypothetical protein